MDIFDEETYNKSEVDFYATITNIESGKAEYVKTKDVRKQMEVFLANRMYKKYPNLIKVIENKYKNYKDTVEKIIDRENKKEIFVIRPSKTLKVGRIEKDENKLQEMYDLGIEDCKNCIKDLKKFIGMEEKND